MYNHNIGKAIQDTGANKNPRFQIFSKAFRVFAGLFIVLGFIISGTSWLDGIIGGEAFQLVVVYGGIVLIVVLIVLAVKYLKSTNNESTVTNTEPITIKNFGTRITDWKAVVLFGGFVAVVMIYTFLTM